MIKIREKSELFENTQKWFWNDSRMIWHCFERIVGKILLYKFPGGNQIDGLPPANTSLALSSVRYTTLAFAAFALEWLAGQDLAELCRRVIRKRRGLAPRRRQRECIKSGEFFAIFSKIHTFNFSDTCFLVLFYHVLSACYGGLLLYAL